MLSGQCLCISLGEALCIPPRSTLPHIPCIRLVNGYPIVPIPSRFGELWEVLGTGTAFQSPGDAARYAKDLPKPG
jgi:hypothetical protein